MMKITKEQIEQKIQELEKKGRGGGPSPKLFDPKFRKAFVAAILAEGDNGSRIQKYMNRKGFILSYKQTHVYMRKLFGTYQSTGRPPKYRKDNSKRKRVL